MKSEYHRFYDFAFADKNAGYFEIRQDKGMIYQNAKFQMGEVTYENPFSLKIEGNRVLAYKMGDGDWVDFTGYPEDNYPESAYPLLLPRVKEELSYFAVSEKDGTIMGRTVLKRTEDLIEETRDGKIVRTFRMKNGVPIEINWGGPVSHLKESLREAVSGSPIDEQE